MGWADAIEIARLKKEIKELRERESIEDYMSRYFTGQSGYNGISGYGIDWAEDEKNNDKEK
jgi:hypothetical protein